MSEAQSGAGEIVARLRYIHRADFRKSEATLLEEALKEVKNLQIGANDCILLLSGNSKIMRFVFGFIERDMIDRRGNTLDKITKVLPSRTYRITQHGTWNPLMIANYAEALGIKLQFVKKFEEYLKAEIREVAAEH